MNENIVEFVESSFLKPLLEIPNITDVSYNGSDIYYVTNDYGRQKYPQKIEEKIIYDFLRQIVNLTDSQFSFSKPIIKSAEMLSKYLLASLMLFIASSLLCSLPIFFNVSLFKLCTPMLILLIPKFLYSKSFSSLREFGFTSIVISASFLILKLDFRV